MSRVPFGGSAPRAANSGLGLLLVTSAIVSALGQGAYRPATPLGLDEYFPVPDDNPLTQEKIELGRALFSDTLLSADRRIACASCHKPDRAFSDDAPVSTGAHGRTGLRNAPALINRAYGQSFFWDGRADSLEEQVLQPIQNPDEMDLTLEVLTMRLRAEPVYVERFKRVLGEEPSPSGIARALASFVRVQRFGNAPYDRFQAGDGDALSFEAKRGLGLFRGRANCVACHVGPNLTDERFHNTGVAWRNRRFVDAGRAAVTGRDGDQGAFKTPTLREAARTGPYMHDGSFETLEAVIDFYDRGGNRNPHLDPEIRPLSLTVEEKWALVTFLRSLNGAIREGVSAAGQ